MVTVKNTLFSLKVLCSLILVSALEASTVFAADDSSNPLSGATSKLKEAQTWIGGEFAVAFVTVVIMIAALCFATGNLSKVWLYRICLGSIGLGCAGTIASWFFA